MKNSEMEKAAEKFRQGWAGTRALAGARAIGLALAAVLAAGIGGANHTEGEAI